MFISVPCPACKRHFNAPSQMEGQKVTCPYCAHPYPGSSVSQPTKQTGNRSRRPINPDELEVVDLLEPEEASEKELAQIEVVEKPGRSTQQAVRPEDRRDEPILSPPRHFPWTLVAGLAMAVLGVGFLVFCLIYVLSHR